MILFGLLPLLAIAPVTLAEVEPAAPAITNAPQLIHARADLTYWQNWASIGGTYLTGFADLAGAIATIVSAKSSAKSCATTLGQVEAKRDLEGPIGVEAMALSIVADGYNQTGDWLYHADGNITFDGFFSNGQVRIHDLYIAGNYTGAHISYEDSVVAAETDLYKRTTWSHKSVVLEYHSYKGVCKTRLTKAQLKEAAEVQLHTMSSNRDKCSCWTYTGGHGWYGEVKIMEVYDGDDYSASCYNTACNAT
ncbi:hypothetical protein N7494_001022 [Penicillium frequentans]|uniref:Uncharacterized protein n=1 Tax=Penicillium frequentans TaxID=3151616 RepID=A0AAD6D718_9EURO|nr:hypothetical protein N7494_001022 [Penicillium glabrum]